MPLIGRPDIIPGVEFPDLERPGAEATSLRFVLLNTQGDIIFRGATYPERLAIGGAGEMLIVNSAGTEPVWASTSISNTTARILAYLGM